MSDDNEQIAPVCATIGKGCFGCFGCCARCDARTWPPAWMANMPLERMQGRSPPAASESATVPPPAPTAPGGTLEPGWCECKNPVLVPKLRFGGKHIGIDCETCRKIVVADRMVEEAGKVESSTN